MDTPFLTIAEATKKTGRSASTIRRLIHALSQDDAHADRSAIQPSPIEVGVYKQKGDTFTWRIREDVLLREFTSTEKQEKNTPSDQSDAILDILQRELDLKNQQIEKQWEVIHALNDRLREGNILMGSLQQRLALPEAPTPKEKVMETSAAKSSKKASSDVSKETPKASEKITKRGILSFWRR